MQRLRTFFRDCRGVAALEFALIAPVLASVLILGVEGWLEFDQGSDMRAALQTGARYYQTGGSDDTAAQGVAMSAWADRPANGTVTVARVCKCGSTPVACSSVCAAYATPTVYVTLTASTAFTGLVQSHNLLQSEMVRVR
jgi:Flp pilus assembly protein TadG